MTPGNVGVIEIRADNQNVNELLASDPGWFINHNDPQLVDKVTNAILEMSVYDKNGINETYCIDPSSPLPFS